MKIADITTDKIEECESITNIEKEEEYWCGGCKWKGSFDEAILLEQRELGCPECGSVVFEV
jgi:transcription initiation factor IIE alpha subunit